VSSLIFDFFFEVFTFLINRLGLINTGDNLLKDDFVELVQLSFEVVELRALFLELLEKMVEMLIIIFFHDVVAGGSLALFIVIDFVVDKVLDGVVLPSDHGV